MIVVDASAAASGLLNDGQARRALGEGQVHVPHLIDSEIASALRRRVLADQISGRVGWATLDTWRRSMATRHPLAVTVVPR